jgi:hypothetical protein
MKYIASNQAYLCPTAIDTIKLQYMPAIMTSATIFKITSDILSESRIDEIVDCHRGK